MNKRFILVFLITILIFTQLNIGYSAINLNEADEFEGIWGLVSGYDDYLSDNDNDWDDAYEDLFGTDDDLFKFFNIRDEDDDKLEEFEKEFIINFQLEYKEAFNSIKNWSNSYMLIKAKYLGKKFGRFDSYYNYFDSENDNWQESYLDRFGNSSILFSYFGIEDEDNEDLDDFESEFASEYKNAFEDGYEEIQDKDSKYPENIEADLETQQKAIEDAETFAEIDAKQAAYTDYYNNQDNDWTKLYPMDYEIKAKYKLEDDSTDYEETFLDVYQKQYQIEYEKAYRNANVESIKSKEDSAYDQGYQLGLSQGESAGYLDLINGVFSDWENSYNNFLNKKSLVSKYYLYRFNQEYIKSFKVGFKTAYEIGYKSIYADTNIQIGNNNLNYKRLTSNEMIIEYSSYSSDFLSGGMASNTTVPLYLEFDEGTVFSIDKYLGINEEQYQKGGTYGKKYSSRIYNIDFKDFTKSVELKKPVKLAFNFNSNANIGIYKYEKGKWFYLPTYYEKGTVYTNIPKGKYSGGTYALLTDNINYLAHENKLHWAYPEIKLFSKRGIINESDFIPSEGYKRKEFCQLILKNTIGHKDFIYEPIINFKDAEKFGKYKNAINYMVKNGYMKGTGNRIFNPNDYITFNEVEIVMDRILEKDFKWEDISKSLEKKRFTKSLVNSDKSNNINKAETLFMIQEVLGSNALFK